VAGDLKQATNLAAQMVGSMGMGGTLISYEAAQGGGPANLAAKVLSNDDGREEVAGVLEAARAEVVTLVDANRHIIEALRDALLENDELVGEEILRVINGAVHQTA
jgi:ATP-dependent Zn protease